MRNSFVIACTFASSLVAITACSSVDSANIKTAGIKPAIHVSASSDKDGSLVEVTLHVGDSAVTFVNLDANETITATADGEQPVTLKESDLLGVTSYSGQLDTKATGTKVTVAVTRPSDTSAPDSEVTMTEQLTLTQPAAGGTVSRANDDINVAWTDSAESQDGVTVNVDGDCIDHKEVTVQPGDTTATIAAGSLTKRKGDNVADQCPITVSAVRQRNGTLDKAWGGGSIFDTFSSSAQLTSKP